ncbi:unnamed protein product [Thlaspi arvense]|uniref:Bet v I/Major latex protein domain-containing protein n=1 Tax=Thlaspi arvense TaxID=13288 RepID=A0AAU9T955_THLAR|nr:unnamed protein product [Thlaspi arvense]
MLRTPLSYLKHRIDEINAETFKYCYTMIEGDALTGKLEKITYEIQLMASPAGGTIAKTTRKYYPLDGVETSEEEIKTGQERSRAMFKVLEDYLIKNPEAYA